MEEIDIIELLKRVKEGKAPKEIEINSVVYKRNTDEFGDYIDTMYEHDEGPRSTTKFWTDTAKLSTKIKILDKPIIEELPTTEIVHNFEDNSTYEREKTYSEDELADKINEIIKWINNKE